MPPPKKRQNSSRDEEDEESVTSWVLVNTLSPHLIWAVTTLEIFDFFFQALFCFVFFKYVCIECGEGAFKVLP